MQTIAGLAGISGAINGTNSSVRFYQPQGICEDAFGNLYISDSGNQTIRKLRRQGTNWVVNTIAGLPGVGGSVNGTGSNARFSAPFGLGWIPLASYLRRTRAIRLFDQAASR